MRTKKESFLRKLSFFVFWLFNLKEHGWGVWGETITAKRNPTSNPTSPFFNQFLEQKIPPAFPPSHRKKRGSAKTEPLFIFVKTQYLQWFLTC